MLKMDSLTSFSFTIFSHIAYRIPEGTVSGPARGREKRSRSGNYCGRTAEADLQVNDRSEKPYQAYLLLRGELEQPFQILVCIFQYQCALVRVSHIAT